jgi:hypothetical protein
MRLYLCVRVGLAVRWLALKLLSWGDKLCGSETVMIPKGFLLIPDAETVKKALEKAP